MGTPLVEEDLLVRSHIENEKARHSGVVPNAAFRRTSASDSRQTDSGTRHGSRTISSRRQGHR